MNQIITVVTLSGVSALLGYWLSRNTSKDVRENKSEDEEMPYNEWYEKVYLPQMFPEKYYKPPYEVNMR